MCMKYTYILKTPEVCDYAIQMFTYILRKGFENIYKKKNLPKIIEG